jgi:hypothetical protein
LSHITKNEGGVTIWRCGNRKCYGAAITEGNDLLLTRNHNHQPDSSKEESQRLLSMIKSSWLETSEKPREIINLYIVEENQIDVVELPKLRNLLKALLKVDDV